MRKRYNGCMASLLDKNLNLLKKIQHISKLQSILQKWSHKETHRWEPWSSECVSTRFVMERSHGCRVLQLAVCGAESPHTHNATNGLKPEFPALYKCWWWVTCSIAVGQSNSWLDSGIRKRLRSYTTAFYTPTLTLSKADAPLVRVKKTPKGI